MDDSSSNLGKFFFCDPHGVELFDEGEDRATEPAGILTVRWGLHLWAHRRGGQRLNFLSHPLLHTKEHSTATRQHNIFE